MHWKIGLQRQDKSKIDLSDKIIIFHNEDGLMKIVDKTTPIEIGYSILVSNETINKILNNSKQEEVCK